MSDFSLLGLVPKQNLNKKANLKGIKFKTSENERRQRFDYWSNTK